jgi:hypothetical protein
VWNEPVGPSPKQPGFDSTDRTIRLAWEEAWRGVTAARSHKLGAGRVAAASLMRGSCFAGDRSLPEVSGSVEASAIVLTHAVDD